MSNVVIYNPSDTTVANRVTSYLLSVNTPDYTSNPNALINPDLSGVSGIAQKFWKVYDSTVVEMDSTDYSAMLPADKTSTVQNLHVDADSYLENLYPSATSASLSLLYSDALTKGLSDRLDYLQPWSDWVEDVREYEDTVETSIEDSTSYAMLNAVSWDFPGNFDSSNPNVTIKTLLGLLGNSISATFEGYMVRVNNNNLRLERHNGRNVMINREVMKIPESGVTLSNTDNLLNSSGGDAGSSMVADTLYYVYVSNNSASTWPAQMRASTTAPTEIGGVKYLGNTGNAKNWRFVGWAQPNGGTNFKDTDNQRLVINQYNRKRLYGYLNPGYQDDDSETTAQITNTNFEATAGNSKFEWIATGDDSIQYEFNAVMSTESGKIGFIGIGEDSTSSAMTACPIPPNANRIEASCGRAYTPTEGYHYLQMLAGVTGGTGTVYITTTRRGSTSDPRATYVSLVLFG